MAQQTPVPTKNLEVTPAPRGTMTGQQLPPSVTGTQGTVTGYAPTPASQMRDAYYPSRVAKGDTQVLVMRETNQKGKPQMMVVETNQLRDSDRVLGSGTDRNALDQERDWAQKQMDANGKHFDGDFAQAAVDKYEAGKSANVQSRSVVQPQAQYNQQLKANVYQGRATTTPTAVNRSDIDRNRQDIDKNTAAINKNTQDIKDLRKAFEHQAEVMDGAMAQGIATSSLVMPYNVGKISTTVALGHSGSLMLLRVVLVCALLKTSQLVPT